MWEPSDKYYVFMLLWLILAVVSSGGTAFVFSVFALTYGGLTLYHTFKEMKK